MSAFASQDALTNVKARLSQSDGIIVSYDAVGDWQASPAELCAVRLRADRRDPHKKPYPTDSGGFMIQHLLAPGTRRACTG